MNKTMAYILENRIIFLAEERSEAYKWYVERVLQAKILFCSKSGLKEQTCFALEGRGV